MWDEDGGEVEEEVGVWIVETAKGAINKRPGAKAQVEQAGGSGGELVF